MFLLESAVHTGTNDTNNGNAFWIRASSKWHCLYIYLLNFPLPDNRAWRVCTQHNMAAWWLHEHCTPSLLWSSSSCSATGRRGALPTLPFPAPPPLPGLIQGALSGHKEMSYNLAITYLFNWCLFNCANLFSGSLLIKPILISHWNVCVLNIKSIECIILTIDFSSINWLAAKSDLIHLLQW